MSTTNNKRRSDKNLHNKKAEDYIPLACHYDSSTLLTKNGELIQTLEISGMSSDTMVTNLNELTGAVRAALGKHIIDHGVACWIHTIRRKQSIDDTLPYQNKFSAYLHEVWARKNRLREKFVNIIYISIVTKSMGVDLNNVRQVMQSTSSSTIVGRHEVYLANAAETLYSITNSMLEELGIYGISRLAIRSSGDRCFSDPLYLYSHMLSFSENDVEVPLYDFSKFLSVDNYAVGSRQIEVVNKDKRTFAAILSLKEYHNAGQEDLFAKALQLSIEFIATEIFYPIDKNDVKSAYDYQNYILSVTKDEQLYIAKGLDVIMGQERAGGFGKQQLSIMIMSSDINYLEINTTKFSKSLSRLGVVHTREDINLENVFWSQLPGNFHYIRKAVGAVVENIGAFVSLQSTPHGRKFSRWGRYVTVMPSTLGTPYFTNFHSERQSGHTCIFGTNGSGKATLMNFLISESMKYNPTIIYLSLEQGPKLFVNAIGGEWFDTPHLPSIPNDSYVGVEILVDILSGQYSKGISAPDKKILDELIAQIKQSVTYDAAKLLVENFDLKGAGEILKKGITTLIKYFQLPAVPVVKNGIIGISLKDLHNEEGYDLRAAFIIASLRSLGFDKESPKILIMDKMGGMLDHPYFTHNIGLCYELAKAHNVILLGAVDTERYVNVSQKQLWDAVDENTDLKIVMSHDNINYNLRDIFGLTIVEDESLTHNQYDNVFIMKPYARRSIITQFNTLGLEKFVRILGGSESDLQSMEEVKAKNGNKPEEWLPEFYKILEK